MALGGDSFALRPRGDSGELIARLLLIRFREDLAEIGEYKSLGHGIETAVASFPPAHSESSINRPARKGAELAVTERFVFATSIEGIADWSEAGVKSTPMGGS